MAIDGGTTTSMFAVAVLPVPPSVELIALVALRFVPPLVPMTFTLKLHAPLEASVAPERLTFDDPALAVIVPLPHDPVNPFGVATASPAGRVSVNPTPLGDEVAFGFDKSDSGSRD